MKAGRLVFRYTDLTLVERYAYSKRSLRYFFRTSDSGRSLDIEDLYNINRLLQNELFRVGRLVDPKIARKKWKHRNRPSIRKYKKQWDKENPEKVKEYSSNSKAKARERRAIQAAKERLAQEEASVITPEPVPLLATHEIQQGQIKGTV